MKWLQHASVVLETYEMRFSKKLRGMRIFPSISQLTQIIGFGFFDFLGLGEVFLTFWNAGSIFSWLLFDWPKFYQQFFFKSPEQSNQILVSLSI